MHQQFNIQQLYVLPTHCIYVFCIYLRTNSDLRHLYHKLIGFYKRDEKFLLRGTNRFTLNKALCVSYLKGSSSYCWALVANAPNVLKPY
jgi:hypothetical protein